VLTRNSEKYLEQILSRLVKISDEVVVLDSGSTDSTKQIVSRFQSVKWEYRTFDNFRSQRNFAAELCRHDYILMMDADEIPDESFCESVISLKQEGFRHEAYTAPREWIVLGKKIHVIYPIDSPDYPVRLFDRRAVSFSETSGIVHETPSGYHSLGRVGGVIRHHTFESREELNRKLQQYTDLAAENMLLKKKKASVFKLFFSPVAAFIKWYLIKGGWRDGSVGWILGKFAFNYTLLKYKKARVMKTNF